MSNKKYCDTLMEDKLRIFLDGKRIKKGDPFTHTTKSPAGSYYVDEEDYEKFMMAYSNCIIKGMRPTVTERPGAYGPLRVDFDLKATLDQGLKRQYTKEILEAIVKYYQEEIKNCVDEEEFSDKTLTCIVLEKKAPRVEEGKVKDGFHLHFPHFVCEGWFQDEYLRSKVTEKMIINKIWAGCKFMEPVEKFIDTGMAKKQWLMYGSAKAEGAEPFLATKAYDLDMNVVTFETVFEEELIGRKSPVKYYLPRFLSIRGYNHYTTLKPQIESKKNAYKPKKSRRAVVAKKRTVEEVLADIQLIKQAEFMGMLSDDRADTYSTWLEVGYVLFNIGQGCDESLQLWIDFSKRSSKFVDGECEEQWSKMKMGDYTIGSIKFMAQRDSPDAYNEWKSMDLRTQLMKSIQEAKPNEWDVAQVVLCMYRDVFKCADSKHDVWAHYADHRWKIVDDAVAIRLKIPTEVKEEYVKLKAYEATRQIGMDESEKAKSEKIEKKCAEMITALKTCPFQDKVLKTCKALFHDPKFMKKLNENRLLFGCENGVIDLGAMIFRDGRPDDYITFSCGLNYQKYSEDDEDVIELKNLTRKVFTNPNLENYFLDAACATLQGGNVNKTFIVGTGDGDNAKTVMYGLLEKVFGEYCIKFPRELLIVGKGASSNGPRPELARVRGKRIAMVQEIAKTEVINIGVLKELTGNDSFFARGMYEKDATEVIPQFTLWMQCNEPPKVPGQDDATWNRIRVLAFESKFVKASDIHKWPVPADEEEQFKAKRFKADTNFAKRLPDIAPVLLWRLFERYKDYKKYGLREPKEVNLATNLYRASNDIYIQFIEELIEPDPKDASEQSFLKLNDLFAEFTSWFTTNHSSYAREKITKITLLHEMSKRFGPSSKQGKNIQGWYGFKIIEEDAPLEPDKQKQLQDILEGKAKKVKA